MEQAKAAAEAAGSEFKDKVKQESIHQFKEALRRLKEQ